MKRTKILAVAAFFLFAHSMAAADTRPDKGPKLLPLANGCHDPEYSWWEYSGIQALTCLLSGQWPSPPPKAP